MVLKANEMYSKNLLTKFESSVKEFSGL
jgi:hypothetical protein